ncbi:MAG: 2-C-methyl-D-erythritol 2,4-cyclodiphosphate synthase [Anaerovoracaceae bacterium]
MYKDKKVYVIIVAAGSGKRMGSDIPKQFLKIGGKTIVETAAIKFNNVEYVDEIIVVTGNAYLEKTKDLLAQSNCTKVTNVICGGKERQDSVYNGLKAIKNGESHDIILIHDGARPFILEETIIETIERVYIDKAVVVGVKTKDTIMGINNNGDTRNLQRDLLYNVQTPQGFYKELIFMAYEQAYNDNFYGTDDASLVNRLGHHISVVNGEYSNIKITTKEDLPMETRIGSGYDVHRLVEGRKLFLGGVEIPFEKGLLGHSDADVAIHSLMDALLGAAGLGDIGKHFPDNDEKYKGISSIMLLDHVKKLITDEGYTVSNADITIIAQRPKIAKYIPAMKKIIAETLDINPDKINIKGTTTEKLGFVGREEGIASEAVCLLTR